jgi:hypothetical protein
MYSKKLFDELKKVEFPNSEFDSNKIKNYLKQINQNYKYRCEIEYIIKSTVHIRTNDLNKRLREMTINYLLDENSIIPDYVFLPKKIGSEQYFFSQIYDLFPSIVIPDNIITNYKLSEELLEKNELNILIVDDAIFSGTNTIDKIAHLYYDNKINKINFIIIIPLQLEQINQEYINTRFTLKSKSIINIIQVPGFLIPPYIHYQNDLLGNESLIMSTCYFDHKVPNNYGSWPQIYLDGELYIKKSTPFGSLFIDGSEPTKTPILDIFGKYIN